MLKFTIDASHDLIVFGDFPKAKGKALEASIQKWRHLARSTKLNESTKDRGPTTCALCHLYYWQYCKGCPVSSATQTRYCGGTPYSIFFQASETKDRRAAARAMVRFLASLRHTRTPRRLTEPTSVSNVTP